MVCQNETATGVTSCVESVRNLLDELDHPALLMVDGISSIGCIEYEHDKWRVDVAVDHKRIYDEQVWWLLH